MRIKMTIRKANNAIKFVETRLQSPFTAKKEKTPLFNKINSIISDIWRTHSDYYMEQPWGTYNRDLVSKFPMCMNHIKGEEQLEKTIDQILVVCPEYEESFKTLYDLYQQVDSAYLPPTSAEEEIRIEREQRDIMKAQEERGLKFEDIYVQGHHCSNEKGTSWTRYDWYLSGARTAYNKIMTDIYQKFEYWKEVDEPDMSDYSYYEILSFWKKQEALRG